MPNAASAITLYLDVLTTGLERIQDQYESRVEVTDGLRAAKIYAVPTEVYTRIYAQAEQRFDGTAIDRAGASARFDVPLPFPAMFIAYSEPIPLDAYRAHCRRVYKSLDGEVLPPVLYLLAHLVVTQPTGIHVFEFLLSAGGGKYVIVEHREDGWRPPRDCEFIVLPEIIRLVSEPRFRTETVLTTMQRYDFRKRVKRTLPPRAYYTVSVGPGDIDATCGRMRAAGTHHAPTHRFDVAGHERLLVERGALPCDHVLDLADRGYAYWSVNQPSAPWLERMAVRGIAPKAPDEWIALRVAWIPNHIKGPGGGPYLPAVRTVT